MGQILSVPEGFFFFFSKFKFYCLLMVDERQFDQLREKQEK